MIEKPIKITDELLKKHFPVPSKADNDKPELCECGHSADTHSPCCVSACGCDEFTPRRIKPGELFKAVMAEIKETAQNALGYEQICEPVQAVRRLAQEFNAVKVQLAEQQERAIKTLLTCATWKCTACGTVKTHRNSTRWRMNGQVFEHQCAGPQAGCFPARMMSAEEVADLQCTIDANRWPDTAAKLLREAEAREREMGEEGRRMTDEIERLSTALEWVINEAKETVAAKREPDKTLEQWFRVYQFVDIRFRESDIKTIQQALDPALD